MLYCFLFHSVFHKVLVVSYWLTYFIICIRVGLLVISQLMCQRCRTCRWIDHLFMLVTKGAEVWSWLFACASDFSVTHFAIGSPLDRASRPIKPKLLMHVFTLMSSKDEFVMVFFVAFPHFWRSWSQIEVKVFTLCSLFANVYFPAFDWSKIEIWLSVFDWIWLFQRCFRESWFYLSQSEIFLK